MTNERENRWYGQGGMTGTVRATVPAMERIKQIGGTVEFARNDKHGDWWHVTIPESVPRDCDLVIAAVMPGLGGNLPSMRLRQETAWPGEYEFKVAQPIVPSMAEY